MNWLDHIFIYIRACSFLDWKGAGGTVCGLRKVSSCPLCASVFVHMYIWWLNHSDVRRCEYKGDPRLSRICCDALEVQDVGGAGDVRWWKSYDWGVRTSAKQNEAC